MDVLDTGRIRLEPEADKYILFTIHSGGEISSSDMILVKEYLSGFNGRVSLLVVRDSHYSFSPEAWVMMMQESASLVKAVAYVDRSYADKLRSDYAGATYLMDVPAVKSFPTKRLAVSWISQFGSLPDRKNDQPKVS